jgi:hypothetical protein
MLNNLIDAGVGLRCQVEQAFTASLCGDVTVADDSAEATCGDEHEAKTIVNHELQRLAALIRRDLV